jgi:hypothetical protein
MAGRVPRSGSARATDDARDAARKPMAPARRVSLYEREIRVHLGTAAIDVLFELAEVLSEGQRQGRRYFGSTMLTFDLARARAAVRDACDASDARQIAALLERDARVEARARALACEAAARRAGAPLARVEVEVRVRADGVRVHVDLDVEAELA